MSTGVVVLVVAVVGALVFGAWRAATDGRFRGTRELRVAQAPAGAPPAAAVESLLVGTPYVDALGERATMLQFSSAFCAPCRATRRILEDVARIVPGVAHVEVDAEHHLDLVRRLDILRTPTTVLLDRSGQEASRASGVPRTEQVLGALAQIDSAR